MDAKTDDKSAGKCPVVHTSGRLNRDWWPNQLNLQVLHQTLRAVRSDGRGVRLRQGIQEPRPQCCDQGPSGPDDGFAGLVAGRLRPLRRTDHPYGVAQRGHVPHRRRPRRRWRRPAALRAAQQLAGQREPRQGAPAAVADQAEIRPQNLLGRPDDSRRQRGSRFDGVQDRSVSAAAAPMSGSPKSSTGVPRGPGWGTNATAANASFRIRSARCRWA
jgi:hypothetical protein